MNKHIFNLQADICKTLGNPKRLEIICALENGELTVTELVKRLKIPKANVSQHLAIMRSKGLLIARRDGLNIYYRISNPKIVKACGMMREVLFEQLEESKRLLKGFKV
jgi:ArsR family transcriptional regulator